MCTRKFHVLMCLSERTNKIQNHSGTVLHDQQQTIQEQGSTQK